jgi:hypothetical protein
MNTNKPHILKSMLMTNISDEPVTIQISAGGPGSGINETTVKPNESSAFPESYCAPVPSAGQTDIPSIVSRSSTRTWPDGSRRPTLYPTDDAKRARAQWDDAKKRAEKQAQQTGAAK